MAERARPSVQQQTGYEGRNAVCNVAEYCDLNSNNWISAGAGVCTHGLGLDIAMSNSMTSPDAAGAYGGGCGELAFPSL